MNALGCGLALLLLSSCASVPPSITVSTKPIEKPTLIVPPVDTLVMKEVKWIIVTEENLDEVIADLKDVKTLADTCNSGYLKLGIYRHRTIGYWNSDWESLQDQTVYLDSIVIRKPEKGEKFKK